MPIYENSICDSLSSLDGRINLLAMGPLDVKLHHYDIDISEKYHMKQQQEPILGIKRFLVKVSAIHAV